MKIFLAETKALTGLQLTPEQISAFHTYETILQDWNQRMSLTSIRDITEIRRKHFLDSLTCIPLMDDGAASRVVDVGTGAGFPGLVLKIMRPELQLTLVESVGKKADFCRAAADALGLTDVDVVTARAEAVGQIADHREQYDWAFGRAVAALPILAEYLLPLLKVGGQMVAQLGQSGRHDTEQAQPAFDLLGGVVEGIQTVHLPGQDEPRYLVQIKKTASTPARFPRRVGIPKKRPLA